MAASPPPHSVQWPSDAPQARQGAFDWDSDPPVIDQRVPSSERRRLSGHSALILERLRLGPVSNRELALLLPPGAAWRTRLSDCRQFLQSQGETISRHDCGGGLVWYFLEVLQ